jgi:rRNA maturation endonuclease Nob1
MIKIDITTLIFFYILFSVVTVLIIWLLFGNKDLRRRSAKDRQFIWKCSVCFNDYIDSKHEDISVCPACGSYNKREGLKVNSGEVGG